MNQAAVLQELTRLLGLFQDQRSWGKIEIVIRDGVAVTVVNSVTKTFGNDPTTHQGRGHVETRNR